jgi:hypothetical protein
MGLRAVDGHGLSNLFYIFLSPFFSWNKNNEMEILNLDFESVLLTPIYRVELL